MSSRSRHSSHTSAPPAFTVGQILEVSIEKLTFNGGRGLARTPQGVVFVEGAAPDEKVRVQVMKVSKKFCEAELVETIHPSPKRRTPPCPYVPDCGGCNLQHLQYDAQVEQKISMLGDLLRPLRKVADFELRSFQQAPSEWHYRNRAQFHFDQKQIGFFRRRSADLIDVEKCLIVEESINLQLEELRRHCSAQPARFELYAFQHEPATSHLPGGFFSQVNSQQNEFLQKVVLQEFKSRQHRSYEEAWDLYGGAGNLSFPLALHAYALPVICVESSKEAVEFGSKRRDQQQIHHLSFDPRPVEAFLKKQKPKTRFIIVDPPRAGLTEEAREQLVRLSANSTVIYISCNPSSFTRDAIAIVNKSSLRPRWIQGLDMFPQTDHIELISCFE